MPTPPYKITLQSPQTHHIQMPEQVMHAIGITSPLPYGAARLTMDTTENWAKRLDYIPQRGEIVVYSDRRVIDGVPYPGIKIGDGKAYGIDLPFAGDDSSNIILGFLNNHINDADVHLVPGEREHWNSKVSCSINGERLILEGMD